MSQNLFLFREKSIIIPKVGTKYIIIDMKSRTGKQYNNQHARMIEGPCGPRNVFKLKIENAEKYIWVPITKLKNVKFFCFRKKKRWLQFLKVK